MTAAHTALARAYRSYCVAVAAREDMDAQMAALRIWGKGRRPTARQRARFTWAKAQEVASYAAWMSARRAVI